MRAEVEALNQMRKESSMVLVSHSGKGYHRRMLANGHGTLIVTDHDKCVYEGNSPQEAIKAYYSIQRKTN